VDGINANGDVTGRWNSNGVYVRHSDGTFDLVPAPALDPALLNGTSGNFIDRGAVMYVGGLNSTDEVAGTVFRDIGFPETVDITQPFLLIGGNFSNFAVSVRLNAPENTSQALALNDGGVVVGYQNSAKTAFLREASGTLTTFTVGAVETVPTGINDSGMICGYTVASVGGPVQGFVRLP